MEVKPLQLIHRWNFARGEILTWNFGLCSADRSFSVMFGAFATWYSLSSYIRSPKLLRATCSHHICETGLQSPPFPLVTWSASGSGTRMAIFTVSDHDVHTDHKMATT